MQEKKDTITTKNARKLVGSTPLTRKKKSLLCSTKTTMVPVRMKRKVDISGEDKNKKQ